MREGRPLPPMLHGWADTCLRVAIPSASALELPAARDQVAVADRKLAAVLPCTAHPLHRQRRVVVLRTFFSLTGSPCSITALARTPCVHAASLPHPRPSASPLPTLSPLPGSTISYSSRVLHMAGSGTFRAIPPYLFGQPLPSPSSARRQETARAARSPRTPGRHLHAIVGAPLLACRPASIVAALWICAALYR